MENRDWEKNREVKKHENIGYLYDIPGGNVQVSDMILCDKNFPFYCGSTRAVCGHWKLFMKKNMQLKNIQK